MFAALASWRQVIEPDRRLVEAVEQLEVALARHAEHELGAVHRELVGEQLPAPARPLTAAARGRCARAGASASRRRRGRRSGSSACPPTRAGSTSTRTNAVSSVSRRGGEHRVGAGLVPPLERAVLVRRALRLDPDRARGAARADPGPGCVCGYATPPGGKSTRSQRTSQLAAPGRSVSSQTSARPSTRAAPNVRLGRRSTS